MPNLHHTNEVIGAYVTASARMHLYGYLDRLQENAISCDTDSLMLFSRGPKRGRSQLGTSWGYAVRNETVRILTRICVWVSKNYAYRVIANVGEITVCKVRGITLNYHTSELEKFEVMRAMILEQGNPFVN